MMQKNGAFYNLLPAACVDARYIRGPTSRLYFLGTGGPAGKI
jgi:hypothetical protein